MKEIPIMPQEFKGEYGSNCGYTTTDPRRWTEKEIEWVKKLIEDGYSNKEIAINLLKKMITHILLIRLLIKC